MEEDKLPTLDDLRAQTVALETRVAEMSGLFDQVKQSAEDERQRADRLQGQLDAAMIEISKASPYRRTLGPATSIVDACKQIVSALEAMHSVPELATSELGDLYGALYAAGARLSDQRGNALRHCAMRTATVGRTVAMNAKDLASMIFDSIDLGARSPDHGADFLKRLAEVFSNSATVDEALKTIDALDKEDGERRRVQLEAEHHARMADAHRRSQQRTTSPLQPQRPAKPAPKRESWHYPTRTNPDGSTITDSDGNFSGVE